MERGCLTSDMVCSDEKVCKKCNTSSCNVDVFDNLMCYICEGNDCLTNSNFDICPIENDECFSRFDGCKLVQVYLIFI